MFAYWWAEALPLYGFHIAIKPRSINFFFQYQLMHLYAEFDEKSDSATKRCLNSPSDWVTEGQRWNRTPTGPSQVPGKERVKIKLLGVLTRSLKVVRYGSNTTKSMLLQDLPTLERVGVAFWQFEYGSHQGLMWISHACRSHNSGRTYLRVHEACQSDRSHQFIGIH